MKPTRVLFLAIFALMLAVTAWASAEEGVVAGFWHLLEHRWNVATLADAYCGFITFFVLIAQRESSQAKRLVLFILILLLGNIAMSAYLLFSLWKLGPQAKIADLFRAPERP